MLTEGTIRLLRRRVC